MANPAYNRREWFCSAELICYRYKSERITPRAMFRIQKDIVAYLCSTLKLSQEEAQDLVEENYCGLKPVNNFVNTMKLRCTPEIVLMLDLEYVQSRVAWRAGGIFLADQRLVGSIDERVANGAILADENWTPIFVLEQYYLPFVGVSGLKRGLIEIEKLADTIIDDKSQEMIDPETGHECRHLHDDTVRELQEIGYYSLVSEVTRFRRGIHDAKVFTAR